MAGGADNGGHLLVRVRSVSRPTSAQVGLKILETSPTARTSPGSDSATPSRVPNAPEKLDIYEGI